ncbi:MAG: hypothetical protein AAGA56_02675 [Myxococcota bacterium]
MKTSNQSRWGAAAGLLLVGCNVVVGLDEPFSEATCADGSGTCLPAVPRGWDGPFMVLESALVPPSSCPAGFAEEGLWGQGVSVPTVREPCGCTFPPGGCGVRLESGFSGPAVGCIQPDFSPLPLPPDVCIAVPEQEDWARARAGEQQATCIATAEPPAAGFQAFARACRAPQLEGLACDGTCVEPGPTAAATCIAQVGEPPCPSTGYTEAKLFYESLSDTRGCDCGEANGTCSGAVVLYSSGNQCQGNIAAQTPLVVNGDCMDVPNGFSHARLVELGQLPECRLPAEGAVTGAVRETGPVTVCCLPEE